MNAHDSERIKGMLEELGLGEAHSADEADVVVFNTCTLSREAGHQARGVSRGASARKREDPDRVIAVGGCYAEAQRDRIFELYPEVDVAFGPGSIAHLGEWLGAGGAGVARSRFGLDDRAFAAPFRPTAAAAGARRGYRSPWGATRRARIASSRPLGAESIETKTR